MKTRKAGCLFSLIKLFILTFLITAVILYFSISYVVPIAVSSLGKAMGVDMNLGSFSFSIREQYVELEDFYIKNPEGFNKGSKAINLNKAKVDLDSVLSNYLMDDLVIIDEIYVDGFELLVESENMAALLSNNNNLAALASKLDIVAENDAMESTDEGSKELKYVIKKISFKNGKLKGVCAGGSFNVEIPDFEITDIGLNDGGLTAIPAAVMIFKEIVRQSMNSIVKTTATPADTGVKSIFDVF